MSGARASDEGARDARIGRIVSDLYDRKARGEPMPEAEILAAYPDLADDLRRYLAVVGELGPVDQDIEGLIARGVLAESDDPKYRATLGAYKTIEFIGRGGMGIVLKAYEESLQRTVALKIIRPDLAEDKIALERFKREAQAAAALRHPNIVTIHAVGEEHGVRFLVMEYVEGPTLAEVIRAHTSAESDGSLTSRGPQPERPPAASSGIDLRGPTRAEGRGSSVLPTALIRELFRQLLSGLAAAHEAGLIHRDIKSSNVLLDGWPVGTKPCQASEQARVKQQSRLVSSRSGPIRPGSDSSFSLEPSSFQLKIADFGLARMAAARTRITVSMSTLGTPEYMSPEQARGEQDLDHRTDLYSAGVVLYEMLTGRTPFKGENEAAVIHRILHDEPADPRSISKDADPHLASLALRLMAKRPEDRFASATETILALEAGKPVSPRGRWRRWLRRMAIGLVVFVLVFGGAWLVSRFGRSPAATTATARLPITDVRAEDVPLGKRTTTIEVKYGDDPTWRTFHRFLDDALHITGVELVDVDGHGRQLVVAGTNRALDGDCLFAFDCEGHRLWSINPSSKIQWPDCSPPTQWFCRTLAVADLDGRPGEEIVVVASDLNEYLERLSIIDPQTREIRATFWHMGNINFIRIMPDFFEGGRPAIIGWGINNKLDGFGHPPPPSYVPPPGEDAPRTKWNEVAVVMILDPDNMERLEGLGPPRTPRVDIPSMTPYAYAFLDLAVSEWAGYLPEGEKDPMTPQPEEIGSLQAGFAVSNTRRDVEDGTGPQFTLGVGRSGGKSDLTFRLDRHLDLRDVLFADPAKRESTEAFWREHWHPIIQNGEYVTGGSTDE
ncbi:MAG: serine/threonine protein kinase [Phycisphaerae bacterium]|nr:serine/threonine protein kinase [Phycisphaerae bacterium]